jgi:starch phosphorylase
MLNTNNWTNEIEHVLLNRYHKNFQEANSEMVFASLSESLMNRLTPQWVASKKAQMDQRQAFYLSAEFLMGRSLINNLINTGLHGRSEELLNQKGLSLKDLEGFEPDAALGNGGLGRLAACFLDSAATHSLPLTGYGIYYEFGLFKQSFVDGHQTELPDDWSVGSQLWCVKKEVEAVNVKFGDQIVKAVPYDMPIVGYQAETINTLRLWKSEAIHSVDLSQFQNQNYRKALKERNAADIISMVLYPNDSTDRGKVLRLKQEYFFVSASLQDMLNRFDQREGLDLQAFHEWHAVQLNDTHPAVAIPELIRLLMDRGFEFEDAFQVAQKTFSYTNHTILSEALEKWSIRLFKKVLPQLFPIVMRIQKRLEGTLADMDVPVDERDGFAIVNDEVINMAWLSIYGSHHTNGVAELHTQILKDKELKHWHELFPKRFINVTNGVTQRRWLKLSNPELSSMITELLGSEKWMTHLEELQHLEGHAENEDLMHQFMGIKSEKKKQLAQYILEHEGVEILDNALYDIQIKRMHEYKRQLLNALHIFDLMKRIQKDPEAHWTPRVFIFGAKAAPGYKRAKAVIRFIHWIKEQIDEDPRVKDKLQVIFVENYSVSYAEKLFPAADISEQISTAGTEASGTGNMKFMINGTVTLGTYDGANVEIAQAVGEDNIFIFGETVESLKALEPHYNPMTLYHDVEGLKEAIDAIKTLGEGEDEDMNELYDSLLTGAHWHKPDHYFVLQDFTSYRQAHEKVAALYDHPLDFAKMAWINMCRSGRFSSDYSIRTYANEIWKLV